MRILVHDSRFSPSDAARFPRWRLPSGAGRCAGRASGWSAGGRPVRPRRPSGTSAAAPDDWLVYRHWDPGRGRYGPIRDFYGYNGGESGADNEVTDLGMEARLTVGDRRRSRLGAAAVRRAIGSWCGSRSAAQGQARAAAERSAAGDRRRASNPLAETGSWPRDRPARGRRSMDRRAARSRSTASRSSSRSTTTTRLVGPPPDETPDRAGRAGRSARGRASCGSIATSTTRASLANTPRQPHGVRSAVPARRRRVLRAGRQQPGLERFAVLERRARWCRGSMFLGKPFLVHLPGQVVPLKVFGRSVCWVPDPRRIRYIR